MSFFLFLYVADWTEAEYEKKEKKRQERKREK